MQWRSQNFISGGGHTVTKRLTHWS